MTWTKKIYLKRKPLALALACCAFLCVASTVNAQKIVEDGRCADRLWSGYWWPTVSGEILKPLAKYDVLTNSDSVGWERKNRPSRLPDGSLPPAWEGLCHGQAASCVSELEPKEALTVKKNGKKETLSVGDQKGLLCVAHAGDLANFYGLRCDDEEDEASKNDLAPDELWQVLRAYLKERKTPIILDIEPGVQVWNYPVEAYRVTYEPKADDSTRCSGEIELWMADNSVPADFVGCKIVYKKYSFEIEREGAAIVDGTGVWTGESAKSHPDFAWAPYLYRSGNSNLSYERVQELLGRSTNVPNAPRPNEEGEIVASNSNVNVANSNESVLNGVDSNSWFDFNDLRLVLANAKPSFQFDLSLDGMNAFVKQGDYVKLNCSSAESGYLYVFAVRSDGSYYTLYPTQSDDNYVSTNRPIELPNPKAPYVWKFDKPGQYKIAALISEKKLGFSGAFVSSGAKGSPKERVSYSLDNLAVVAPPCEAENGKTSDDAKKIEEAMRKLGRYSCDTETFFVEPKK